MQLTVVYGAPTPPGRLAAAVDHVAERLSGRSAVVSRIDLHAEPLAPMRTDFKAELDARNAHAIATIDGSDAVVFGSPDRHMRDILGWFGAIPLPTSIYLTHDDFENGHLRDDALRTLDELAQTLLSLTKRLYAFPSARHHSPPAPSSLPDQGGDHDHSRTSQVRALRRRR